MSKNYLSEPPINDAGVFHAFNNNDR